MMRATAIAAAAAANGVQTGFVAAACESRYESMPQTTSSGSRPVGAQSSKHEICKASLSLCSASTSSLDGAEDVGQQAMRAAATAQFGRSTMFALDLSQPPQCGKGSSLLSTLCIASAANKQSAAGGRCECSTVAERAGRASSQSAVGARAGVSGSGVADLSAGNVVWMTSPFAQPMTTEPRRICCFVSLARTAVAVPRQTNRASAGT